MGAVHCALCSRKLLLVICASSSSARNGTYYLEIVLNCAIHPLPAVKIVKSLEIVTTPLQNPVGLSLSNYPSYGEWVPFGQCN